MNVLKEFSEQDKEYFRYQARLDAVRDLLTNKARWAEGAQKLAEAQGRLAELEGIKAKIESEKAKVESEKLRAEKAEAIAQAKTSENERLLALLKNKGIDLNE
jgi:hypothetical protein